MNADERALAERKCLLIAVDLYIDACRLKTEVIPVGGGHDAVALFHCPGILLVHDDACPVLLLKEARSTAVIYVTVSKEYRGKPGRIPPNALNIPDDRGGTWPGAGIDEHEFPEVKEINAAVPGIGYLGAAYDVHRGCNLVWFCSLHSAPRPNHNTALA
jgi:hypothetical protein